MTTSPSWHGWLWTGDSWERVCSGASLSECSRRLGEHARRRRVPDRLCVMTGGGSPAFVPKDSTQAILCDANSNSRKLVNVHDPE
jgi:hypothetical protein